MKKNRIFSLFLAVIYLLCGLGSDPQMLDAASLAMNAPSFAILDANSGAILHARSANVKRAPASTTKILSAMVILDHLKPDQLITVSSYATTVQPSKIHIRAGDQFYVRDLLKAMLLRSANDAAYALAIATGGSIKNFAKLMNEKAKRVGARNSYFYSPAGLPYKGQYSTPYDLAKIMLAAQKYDTIVSAMRMKSTVIYSRLGRKYAITNTNKMLWKSSVTARAVAQESADTAV